MTEPQSADAEPARKCTDKTRRVAMSPFESNDALRRAERSWHDGVTFAKALRSPPAAALEKVECPLWVEPGRMRHARFAHTQVLDQYSCDSSIVVTDRSASVMIQTLLRPSGML